MKKFLSSLLFLIPLLTFSQDCTELQVTMFDSYGDGWNGNVLTVGNESVTLLSGAEGIDTICVNLDECNTITVGGGSWQSEVSWIIEDIIGGIAPFDSTLGDCGSLSGCMDSLALNCWANRYSLSQGSSVSCSAVAESYYTVYHISLVKTTLLLKKLLPLVLLIGPHQAHQHPLL